VAERYKKGDIVIRGPIPGATQTPRRFRLTLVNDRVFSAESADDRWSGWGGPIADLHRHAKHEPIHKQEEGDHA
jgi:hypothetical protein